MDSVVDRAKVKVRGWTEAHQQAVLYDEPSATLLDVAAAKNLRLPWGDLKAFEEKIHPETHQSYVVLLFDGGYQIALVDPGGIAFEPSAENTGPMQNLPAVVCLKDYYTLKARVEHYLYDHPDEPPPQECLDAMLICIATLDGARAVGFDITDLEEALEKALKEIERRTGSHV